MGTDTPQAEARGGRPRPVLLIALGIAAAVFVVLRLGGSADPEPPASNAAAGQSTAGNRGAGSRGGRGGLDPTSLDVKLEALEAERAGAGATIRNPFRFKPAAPPPAAAPSPRAATPDPPIAAVPSENPGPPPPPASPPITVKFIGVIDRADGTKLAIFSDCSAGRRQSQASEGGVVEGRYRLVRIGMQSVIIEHLDGRGRTTLAQGGQECVK